MHRRMTRVPISAWLLAAGLAGPIWSQAPFPTAHVARPGSINYVEGEAFIGTLPVTASAVGTLELERDQSIVTHAGKIEILLTPGIFLRLADNSSLKMISPDLANIEVQLDQGRALVEVIDIHPANNIRIDQNGAKIRLLKKGLYDFDAIRCEVRVIKGSAQVNTDDHKITLNGKQSAALDTGALKAVKFEPRSYEDEFYRWSGLRSGYLSEASVDAARVYVGPGPSWYGPGWGGFGWYWSPWFGAYTFLPADGVYVGPFGWGFYSPVSVYWSPYMYYRPYLHRFGDFHYPYGHGFPPPGGRPGRVGR